MLILTRKEGQTLHIGDEIAVTVTQIKGKQVRIGIDAPKDVPIHREEAKDKVRKKQRSQNLI